MGNTLIMYPTLIIEDFIEEKDLNTLNKSFDGLTFELNPSAKIKTYSTLFSYSFSQNFEHYSLIEHINNSLIRCIEKFYGVKVDSYTGNSVVKYEKNYFIDKHKDWEPNDDWVIKHNKKQVHLSSVFYFNDDYTGGELVFYDEKNLQKKNLTIKPKSNSVIFFDALHLHATEPISSGIKYSHTNFYTLEV
jgi:Rps23 Pro-64 3,4-dihydroxylase Tpa1-like proline 4-hydroxylase